METVAKVIPRFAAAAVFALTLGGPAAGSAPPTVWNARVQFLPGKQPALYLQLHTTGELRIAGSAAGLATTKPLKATDNTKMDRGGGEFTQQMGFAETPLPVSLAGVEGVKIIVGFYGNRHRRKRGSPMVDEATLAVRFGVAMRDRANTKWMYMFSVETPLKANLPPDSSPVIKVPDLQNLKLTIGTDLEGRKAGIGLELRAGSVVVDQVLVGTKNATCALEVLDADGEVLHSAKGDLERFGFT